MEVSCRPHPRALLPAQRRPDSGTPSRHRTNGCIRPSRIEGFYPTLSGQQPRRPLVFAKIFLGSDLVLAHDQL